MPLPDKAAIIQVRNLLTSEFDESNVTETFKTSWISTGWWTDDTPNAQITLGSVSEDTSPTGIKPDGSGLSSWVDGAIDVNVWVPYDGATDSTFSSSGGAKDMRYELAVEVHRVIEANQDASATTDLTRLETGQILDDPPGRDPPPFSALVPVGFMYHTSP